MVRNEPIERRRSILPAGLGVGAGALLLPPLAVAAAMTLLAYYPSENAAPKREGPQTVAAAAESNVAKTPAASNVAKTPAASTVAQTPAVSTVAKTVPPRPQPSPSFVLAGAEHKFSGRPPDVAPPARQAAKDDRVDSTPLPGTKDLDRLDASDVATSFGPAVVSVVRVSKAPAEPEVAALETPPSTETRPALAAPVYRAYASRSRAFHAKARVTRHENPRRESSRRDNVRHDGRGVHVAAKHQVAHARAPSGTVRARARRG
jgi:hypothetical protein